LAVAVIGFSVFGAGIAVVPPTVISIAGSSSSATGLSYNDAIAVVSSVGYVGIMVGPPFLGGLSALFGGLQWSFLADAGLMLFITIIAATLPLAQLSFGSKIDSALDQDDVSTFQ
jgi:MFS family permease